MVLASADALGNKDQVHSNFMIRCREGGMMTRFYLGQQKTFLLIKIKDIEKI